MPADSISPLTTGKGPAIWMDEIDHALTASFGSSKEAERYREAQAALIAQGKYREAIQMDIADIRGKFGTRYDSHINQMIDYAKKIGWWK